MGCFGCFGGAKDRKRRKQRINRGSPQAERNRVQNVQQESVITTEQITSETPPTNLVSELRNKPEAEEQLSPSPRKRVTFNSNVTTYEHVLVHESVDSLPEINANIEIENQEDLIRSQSQSLSEDDNSVISSVKSYPPHHRYHNARDSDDEFEEFAESDLDELDDLDDEDDYNNCDEENSVRISGQEVWSESVLTASVESNSKTGIHSAQVNNEEVESPMMNDQLSDEEIKAFGSMTNARDRSDYINSVLNPVENITQWKTAKSKVTSPLKPQKENLTANFEAPRASFSSEPTFRQTPSSFKSKSDQTKNASQEIAVDASLSNWLVSPEVTPSKKTSFSGPESVTSGKIISEGSTSVRNFDDRPILGALTVEELRQIKVSSSPRKSPSRSPDEMPIIGTVGTYWSHSGSGKISDSASSYKGIPNTTSKYREDKKVNWHSTPFETRLDRALNRGATEA